MRKFVPLTFPPLSIDRYSFMRVSELGHPGDDENVEALKQQQMHSNPFFRLRVHHSTTVLLRSTYYTNSTFILMCRFTNSVQNILPFHSSYGNSTYISLMKYYMYTISTSIIFIAYYVHNVCSLYEFYKFPYLYYCLCI